MSPGRHGVGLREDPDSNWSSPGVGPNVASYACDHAGAVGIPTCLDMFRLGCAAMVITEAWTDAPGRDDGSGLVEPAMLWAIEVPLETTSRRPTIAIRIIVGYFLLLRGGANPPAVPEGVCRDDF